MVTPNISKKQACCGFGTSLIVVFGTGYIMLFFQKPINYHEDGVITLTLWQAHYKVYCQVNPRPFRYWKWLKKPIVCIPRGFSLLTHVAIAEILLYLSTHNRPIIVTAEHIQCLLDPQVAYSRLVVHLSDHPHPELFIFSFGHLDSICLHQ